MSATPAPGPPEARTPSVAVSIGIVPTGNARYGVAGEVATRSARRTTGSETCPLAAPISTRASTTTRIAIRTAGRAARADTAGADPEAPCDMVLNRRGRASRCRGYASSSARPPPRRGRARRRAAAAGERGRGGHHVHGLPERQRLAHGRLSPLDPPEER